MTPSSSPSRSTPSGRARPENAPVHERSDDRSDRARTRPRHDHATSTTESRMSTDRRSVPDRRRGLPEARATRVVELADGDQFELRIAPVAKQLGDATVRMLAYNGSIPGPTLQVPGGLRDPRQRREPGRPRGDRPLARPAAREPLRRHARDADADARRRELLLARVTSPTRALYWYHPHIREDYGQEMGLYGNVLVEPSRPRLLAAGAPRGAR